MLKFCPQRFFSHKYIEYVKRSVCQIECNYMPWQTDLYWEYRVLSTACLPRKNARLLNRQSALRFLLRSDSPPSTLRPTPTHPVSHGPGARRIAAEPPGAGTPAWSCFSPRHPSPRPSAQTASRPSSSPPRAGRSTRAVRLKRRALYWPGLEIDGVRRSTPARRSSRSAPPACVWV
jgi:hypothetical protein